MTGRYPPRYRGEAEIGRAFDGDNEKVRLG